MLRCLTHVASDLYVMRSSKSSDRFINMLLIPQTNITQILNFCAGLHLEDVFHLVSFPISSVVTLFNISAKLSTERS